MYLFNCVRLPRAKALLTSVFVVLAAALSYAAEPSGTLPLLHIDTENGAAITSKEDYVNASLYLDANGVSGVEPVGSADAPVSLKIKGRGNYTWTGFDKKPYRLKFDKKVSILGMKKNKHFGLLAHADDNLGFLRNAVGFELSRKLGLAWTPTAEPVEVLLNGEYIGLYFLTELIRVDPDRVDIVEQADNATDAEAVTGGWLVEIDNYDTDPHIEITEGNGERIIFTYKTPEILSSAQGSYLTSQMTAINAAIYTSDKSSTEWEKYVDIDALARYYVVQEILDDCESFHGSCYMHKQLGNDTKWVFGPVWDFGNAYQRGTLQYIWDRPTFNQTWIGEIYKFPRFQAKVKEVWREFCAKHYADTKRYIGTFADKISAAASADAARWPNYGNSNEQAAANSFLSKFVSKIKWLGQQWEYEPPRDWSDYTVYLRGNLNGWGLSNPMTYNPDGTFSIESIDLHEQFKLATEDWNTIDLGSNGEAVIPNTPYVLKDKGANMTLKDNASISNAKIVLNPSTKTMTVIDPAAVNDIQVDGSRWSIVEHTIHADNYINVYTATGAPVASGSGDIRLPASGFYIVSDGLKATKVIIR